MNSLHVPMRMFYLRLQIDRVGKTGVQDFDDFGLGVLSEIDAAGKVDFSCCGGHLSSLAAVVSGRSLVVILCTGGNGIIHRTVTVAMTLKPGPVNYLFCIAQWCFSETHPNLDDGVGREESGSFSENYEGCLEVSNRGVSCSARDVR